VSHHIIFIIACAQNVFPNTSAGAQTLTQLTNGTFNNRVTRLRAAHSLLMHYFSSSTCNF